jgi:hypothetical protein
MHIRDSIVERAAHKNKGQLLVDSGHKLIDRGESLLRKPYGRSVENLSTDRSVRRFIASGPRGVAKISLSESVPFATGLLMGHAEDEIIQSRLCRNVRVSLLSHVNLWKKLVFLLLYSALSALPTPSQLSRIELSIAQQATTQANSRRGVVSQDAKISAIWNAMANATDVGGISKNINSSSNLTDTTNPCPNDGRIWASTGGCFTTIGSALQALGSTSGTIIVPPGTWTTADTLTINGNGQHILCGGIGSTIISYTGGPSTAIFDIGTSPTGKPGYVNISINGCTISGNANVQYAIRTRGVHHSDFSHNSLINVTTAGIQTLYGVALVLDDLHTSFIEQAFTVQPQSCIILDGPDIDHRTTTSTVKVPVCEGVIGTGIALGNTADIRLINGTSEQNNKGLTISVDSQNATVDGTDFELNAISDIEISGNQTRLSMVTSLGLTHILSDAYYTRLDGGLYNNIAIDSGALDTHLEKLSYNNYGNASLTDNGYQTSKFRVVNLAHGYDPDVFPENLSIAGITNNTGIQAFNTTSSCITPAMAGTTCTTAPITLPVGYTDTNYRLACIGLSPENVPAIQTVTKSNTTFTITIVGITAAPATYLSFDCTAVHN